MTCLCEQCFSGIMASIRCFTNLLILVYFANERKISSEDRFKDDRSLETLIWRVVTLKVEHDVMRNDSRSDQSALARESMPPM